VAGCRGLNAPAKSTTIGRSCLPLVLTGSATLRFVPEFLLPVELLFTSGKDEISSAIHTFQYPIREFNHGTTPKRRGETICIASPPVDCLLRFPAALLPVPFAGESGFNPLFLPWLQIEGMTLDLFNDVFLLHLPLEAA
jgi:hypothetical protein